MKVIYTDRPKKPQVNEFYRLINPFFGVISAATEVEIEGSAPHIVKAYKSAGIKVSSIEGNAGSKGEAVEPTNDGPEQKSVADMNVPELKQHLADQGVEFESKATKAQLLELVKE